MSLNLAAAAKSIASKALHWRLSPAPRDITESRHVLSILQEFGEVTTFKWLKYDKPAFENDGGLVIFRKEEAVQNLLRQAPVQFVLERVKEEDVDEQEGEASSSLYEDKSTTASRTSTGAFWHSTPSQNAPSRPPSALAAALSKFQYEHRPFKLYAEPWTGDHRAYNERQKFFNPMPRLPFSHPIRADLAKRVPLSGLADVLIEPEGGEIELEKLRRWKAEVERRPKLREWMTEAKKKTGESEEKAKEKEKERSAFFDPLRPFDE